MGGGLKDVRCPKLWGREKGLEFFVRVLDVLGVGVTQMKAGLKGGSGREIE